MDLQVETEIIGDKKTIYMKPIAPEFEGETFFIELYKVFPKGNNILGVFRGVVGKDLVCTYLTDPYEGNVIFDRIEPLGYYILLKIKDESVDKTIDLF